VPTTSDFKKHLRILLEDEPFAVVEHTLQTPSARGSATLVRARLRNLLTGQLVDRTFKAGTSFDAPDLHYRPAQFLYGDGDALHFMDEESFDQFAIPVESLREITPWLVDGTIVRAVHYRGTVATVELPQTLEVEVVETEPAVRGNTASGKVMKRAVVASGAEVQVPLFVGIGERIEVDPRDGRFIRRST